MTKVLRERMEPNVIEELNKHEQWLRQVQSISSSLQVGDEGSPIILQCLCLVYVQLEQPQLQVGQASQVRF